MEEKLSKLMQQFVNDFIAIVLSSSVKDLEQYKEAHLSPAKCSLTPEERSARGRKGAETRKRNKQARMVVLQEAAIKASLTLAVLDKIVVPPEKIKIAVPSDRIMGDLPMGPSIPE
jgi:hypothetical protein